MAAFPSREHEAFMAHWQKILTTPACACRTILADGVVAGNIGAWTDATTQARLIGYWIGREFWGNGIATAALREFMNDESTRPLTAFVAKHNLGSLRVLQKCGFAIVGDESSPTPEGAPIEEWILKLGSAAA